MIPTLPTFSRALLTPDLALATLLGARIATGPNGLPLLMRTTRFVEAQIEWQGRQWLLSMPLTPTALLRCERFVPALRRLNSEWLADYRILPCELCWCDEAGEAHRCDLILQHLPAGRTFADALLTEEKATLLSALDALEAELHRIGFTHNNLKAENLRWCGGKLVPLRYHDAQIGEPDATDATAFGTLRHTVTEATTPSTLSDTNTPYDPLRPLTGHVWVSHIHEGLICVQDESGYGYVDTANRQVIAPTLLWADDFHEGRAEVETPTGMGLIDCTGRFVIEPEYEIVDYKPAQSVAHVRKDGRWALFDYLGHRLTEFGTNHEL